MPASASETVAVPLFRSAEAAANAGPAQPSPEAVAPDAPSAVPVMSLKDAILNCRKAWNHAFTTAKARGEHDVHAREDATAAYCAAMPFLTSHGNIRAYMACVCHAMTTGILRKSDGLQLMVGARSAFAVFPREHNPGGRPLVSQHP